MLGLFISDDFLQMISQIFLFGIFCWMTFSYSKNKRMFALLSFVFLFASFMTIYNIQINLILSLIYLLSILYVARRNEIQFVLICFLGYMLINKLDLLIHINDETLSYMMLKIILSDLYLFIYQMFIIITKRITGTKTLFVYQIVLFIICMISNVLIFMNNQTMLKEAREILYIPILVISVLYVIVSELLISFVHRQELQELLKIQDIKNKALLQQYTSLKEKYEDISILKHDIKNHLQTISILNEQKKYNIIEDYLKKYLESIQEYSLYFHSSHSMFEIVINEKYSEAKKLNINFEIEYEDIDFRFIEDMDIVSIFANVLDNAIEANEDISKNRYVYIKVTNNSNYCVFQIENPYYELLYNSNYILKSTKRNHDGLGITSIRKAVEKYNGMVTYKTQNDTFKLTIMIPLNIENGVLIKKDT